MNSVESLEYARYIVLQEKQEINDLLLSSEGKNESDLHTKLEALDFMEYYILCKLREILK